MSSSAITINLFKNDDSPPRAVSKRGRNELVDLLEAEYTEMSRLYELYHHVASSLMDEQELVDAGYRPIEAFLELADESCTAAKAQRPPVTLRDVIKQSLALKSHKQSLEIVADNARLLAWLKQTDKKRHTILSSLYYYARKYHHELELVVDTIRVKLEQVDWSTSDDSIAASRIDAWTDDDSCLIHPSWTRVSLRVKQDGVLHVRVEWKEDLVLEGQSKQTFASIFFFETTMSKTQLIEHCIHAKRPVLLLMGREHKRNYLAQLTLSVQASESMKSLLE